MFYKKQQINLLFTIPLYGISIIFVRQVLYLYVAKVSTRNAIKKRLMVFPMK